MGEGELHEIAGTAEVVRLEEFGLGGDPYRHHYSATHQTIVPLVFRSLNIRESDVFVDYGSGKGRMLLAAGLRPFRRIVGVEIAAELCDIARRNVDQNRRALRCQDFEITAADVIEWEPPDDMTVAYFANPFSGHVFRKALENIIASLDRSPRKLTLVYLLAPMHADIEGSGRFRLARTDRFGEHDHEVVRFYEALA